jgi:type 2 lantibiotic biosynthesis protein LanM
MSLLTPAEARALTFRAASLAERRQLLSGRSVPLNDTSLDRLQSLVKTWLQAFAPGRPDALERRLAWDELTLDDLQRVVAEAHDVESLIEAAPWNGWIDDVLDAAPTVARDIATGSAALPERALFADAPEPPFLEILAACARAATARLRGASAAWDAAADGVRQALTRQLLRDLAGVSDLALHGRFQQWRATPRPSRGTEVYAGFVMHLLRGGLLDVWMAFPVLGRHIATMLDTWTTATRELLDRAAADRAALEAVFGPLGEMQAVSPSLSDPHDGRRRVAIVTFASGTSLVYKPRDVGLEAAWASFVSWANGAGLSPPQPVVRVVTREGYGWCEMATPGRFTTADEVDTYYRVAGGLVALAYVLRGRDLQMENIVATSAGPAIIDAEMLCQPTRDVEIDTEGRPRLESCLASGLLTMAHVGPADAVFDIGGLRGDGVTPTSLGRRRWTDLGTDAIAYSDERVITSASANRVLFDGELQDPVAHRHALLDGFRAAYRFLLDRKDLLRSPDGPLAPFAAGATRVLFRPSQHYGSVQYALAAPQYQTSGVLRSCALDTLNRIFNLDETRPTLWPVVNDEREALDSLDLPRYAVPVAGTQVRSLRGPLDVPFFRRSGLDGVHALVNALSEQDLARQERVIDQALLNAVGKRLETPLDDRPGAGRDVQAWLLAQADALGTEILGRASRDGDEIRWLTFDAMPGRWARHAFYDGSVGAAVFLAAWAKVADHPGARAAVRPAVAGLLALIETDPQSVVSEVGIGGCTGVGSLVYGLCALHALTGDRTYLDAADRLARTLTAAHACTDVTYDVTGGSAGTILGLLAVHAATGDDAHIATARPFADHLLAKQAPQATGAAWPTTRRETPIAGFAHGSAGIGLALARLAQVSGDERYRVAAARAIAHERTLFAPSLRNWPVLGALDPSSGSGHSIMTAWCHGAAGIGLARASLPAASRDGECGAEMATALAAIDASPLTALDQICCGNLGRADILITLGLHLDRAEVVQSGIELAGRAADRAALRQFYGLRASGVDYRVFDPGLFRGLAGIGYVLMRAARPDVLPCLLTFAPLGPPANA